MTIGDQNSLITIIYCFYIGPFEEDPVKFYVDSDDYGTHVRSWFQARTFAQKRNEVTGLPIAKMRQKNPTSRTCDTYT